MGKITGFMEFERQEEGYLEPAARLKNYKEFVLHLSDPQAKVQAARCMDCGIPFCNSGCPVNNIIPDWNDLVYHGNYRAALENLHSTNNFPEFTGRICPLTPLENHLRVASGAAGYQGGFVEHYLLPVLYPADLTRELQWALGAGLVAFNVIVYALLVWRRSVRLRG